MYAIKFIGHDKLEIQFNENMSVFVRGQMHCTDKMTKDLVDQCILLFERMIVCVFTYDHFENNFSLCFLIKYIISSFSL